MYNKIFLFAWDYLQWQTLMLRSVRVTDVTHLGPWMALKYLSNCMQRHRTLIIHISTVILSVYSNDVILSPQWDKCKKVKLYRTLEWKVMLWNWKCPFIIQGERKTLLQCKLYAAWLVQWGYVVCRATGDSRKVAVEALAPGSLGARVPWRKPCAEVSVELWCVCTCTHISLHIHIN